MKQSKLGISVGLLGAGVYLIGLFSGYPGIILLAGYVLLFEENQWLKRSATKAVVLLAFFSLLTVAFNLVPNAIGMINNIASIFGGSFSIVVLTRIVSAITSILDVFEKVLLIALGIKALKQGTIVIPPVDKLVSAYME